MQRLDEWANRLLEDAKIFPEDPGFEACHSDMIIGMCEMRNMCADHIDNIDGVMDRSDLAEEIRQIGEETSQ